MAYINYIHLLKFLIAILVFFIKKRDGSLLLVQNYRVLITVMVNNQSTTSL